MPEKENKKWFKYNMYRRVGSICDASALSSIPLPERTEDYHCAMFARELPENMRIGRKVDLIFGDPRLLKGCVLVEKGLSKMPDSLASKIWLEKWWTWKWKGHLIFLKYKETVLAKNAKKKKL